jgi:hypothetical protein
VCGSDAGELRMVRAGHAKAVTMAGTKECILEGEEED